MLVLTRKLGEGIVIGDQIKVVILEVNGGKVKLGIKAPPGVPIHREEVLSRITSENKNAADLHPERLEDILARGMVQNRPPEQREGEKK